MKLVVIVDVLLRLWEWVCECDFVEQTVLLIDLNWDFNDLSYKDRLFGHEIVVLKYLD